METLGPWIEHCSITVFLTNSKIPLESYDKEMRTGFLLSESTYVKKS